VATGSFDIALCNFGLLHFGQPERAAREMARVLRSGGKAVLTVWAPPEDDPLFGAIYRAIEKHATKKPDVPVGAPFFHFAVQANFTQLLVDAGFRDVTVGLTRWKTEIGSGRALVDLFQEGSVRT